MDEDTEREIELSEGERAGEDLSQAMMASFRDPFFKEGYEARTEGAEWADCPYGEDTDGQAGWRKGWNAADAEGES